MLYEDYLERWAGEFGAEAESGVTYYLRGGKRQLIKLHRMTEEEFDVHVMNLEAANDAFNEAAREDDDTAMKEALDSAFPHELALLI